MLIEEFLGDYLVSGAGEPQLEHACSKELPKDFLHFIFEQIDTVTDGSSK